MKLYILTGNTYPWRQWLKNIGAQWSPSQVAWKIQGSLAYETLQELRAMGIRVRTI